MKTIEIDDDLYLSILRHTTFRGESECSILHRLLGTSSQAEELPLHNEEKRSAIADHLNSTNFKYAKGAVGRFLSLLGVIYQANSTKFSEVEQIKGRGRIYFSNDVNVLHKAGRSVNPKQIPGSPYWVITNTPTNLKQEILVSVMRAFDYQNTDISDAISAVEG